MKKIGSIMFDDGVVMTVYHCNDRKFNLYRLYYEAYYQDERHDWPTKHKKLLVSYADLSSCLFAMHTYSLNHKVKI